MFRKIREMKAMPEGAHGTAEQAQRLALATTVRRARQAGTLQVSGPGEGYAAAGYARAGRNFEPIAGVSLEQYAAIVKCAAAFGHDPSKMAQVAEARGISSVGWQMAVTGWNARLRGDSAVARRFNLRYRES